MWKNINGKLYHVTDNSRVKFRTNISKQILMQLSNLAETHDTYINYLLENGLSELLEENLITYNKKNRPKDRIQYKSTYDRELLAAVKEFSRQHNLFINDVIEYSVSKINIEKIRDRSYKHRIERM